MQPASKAIGAFTAFIIIGVIGFAIFGIIALFGLCAACKENKCCICMNMIFVLIIGAISSALFIVLIAMGGKFGTYLDEGCTYATSATSTDSNIISGFLKDYVNIYPSTCAFGIDPTCPVAVTTVATSTNITGNIPFITDMTCTAQSDSSTCAYNSALNRCTLKATGTEKFKNIQAVQTAASAASPSALSTACKEKMYPPAKKYFEATATLLGWLESGDNKCAGMCSQIPMNYFSDVDITPGPPCKDVLKTLITNNFQMTWIIALVLACLSYLGIMGSFCLCCHPQNKNNQKRDG